MNIYRHHKTTNIIPGVNSLIRLTKKLLVALLSTALHLRSAHGEVQLFLLQLRVRLLTTKLYDLCPHLIRDEAFVREKAADSLTVEQNLEIEQQINEHVLALMDECNRQATTTTSTPGEFSCGSSGAYWSDSPLPTRVGETVNITFYESYFSGPLDSLDDCKDNGAHRGRAIRCSADRGGVVYIMDEAMDGQDDTVCGMY